MKKIRTAAYCRVSTKLEEQEGSFNTQMSFYEEKIKNDPERELVGVYGDMGKSGTKVTGREGLQKLLDDCKAGKVDEILTKSISRFARDMADCVDMINNLRALGVKIIFEKENIKSDDFRCDLMLNILAAIAQEESNSISQNATRSHVLYASEGRPFGRVSYGYDGSKGNIWTINQDEAKRVRLAFKLAAEGNHYPVIIRALNEMESCEQTGYTWYQKRLKNMLMNVVYMGDYHSHEHVCLTPGHEIKNNGYRDRFYIREHHEPIVTRSVFERVQKLIKNGLLISYYELTNERKEILTDNSWKDAELGGAK